MKLTNAIRDAFVRAAMDDVPQVDYTEAIRKIGTDAVLEALPPSVRKVWDDAKTRPYLVSHTRWMGGVGVHVPSLGGRWNEEELPAVSSKATKAIADLETKKNAQEETRKGLQQKLRGAAYSCSTRKGLADLLPEFAKYLPADDAAAIRTLPVIANIVSDFTKAGWPKGKKPAKA
jgi:hypothetical protein